MMAAKAPPAWKQPPLFKVGAESVAPKDAWRLDELPASLGTLPREVYQAYRVLATTGPCDRKTLLHAVHRAYWRDFDRIVRTIDKLANCGYVTTDANGIMTAKEHT